MALFAVFLSLLIWQGNFFCCWIASWSGMEPINSFAYLIMTLDGMSIECCCHLSSCISFCSYPSAILFESIVIVVVTFGANLLRRRSSPVMICRWNGPSFLWRRLGCSELTSNNWLLYNKIQLLSVGNDMMWGMDEVPSQSTLIVVCGEGFMVIVWLSILISRPFVWQLFLGLAVQQSNGWRLMEI